MITTETDIQCEWCDEPATLMDKTSDGPVCEMCARHWFGVRVGEGLAAARAIQASIEIARSAGASDDEIRAAVDRALNGGEALVGAAAAEFKDRTERYRETGKLESDSRLWAGSASR